VSTNANGRKLSLSTPTIPRESDWSMLSPRKLAILRLIATPISEGYSITEIARELKTTRRWVLNRLDELRKEIERLRI
jgi:DNA-binding NarL/FixJ family response regulator